MDSSCSKTPIKIAYKLRPGYIGVHKRWENTLIMEGLKGLFHGVLVDDLKDIDFYLSANLAVIYISESKLLMANFLIKLTNSAKNVIYITDRNTLTVYKFSELQDQFMRNERLLLPIGNNMELPLVLNQLYLSEVANTSPLHLKKRSAPPSDLQIQLLLNIPGLGRIKAIKLLDYFGSVKNVAIATEKEMISLIGASSSSQVYTFFHNTSQDLI